MSGLVRSTLVLFLLSSTALAQEAGTAVSVNQNANAAGGAGARVLLTQGAVYQGDQITTDQQGIAQIIFVDNTRFVVGPNSKAVIDRFVFNPDNTAQAVTLTATKGAFRFISGISRSQVYNIRTPAMTIGVRGTTITFLAEAGTGKVTVMNNDGGMITCDANNECIIRDNRCSIVIGLPGQPVADATDAEREEAAESVPFDNQILQGPFQANDCQASSSGIPPALDTPINDPEDRVPDRPEESSTPS